MAHLTPERLRSFPWIVSCDTLRLEDLLPRYWSAAETLELELPAPLTAELERLAGADSNADDWRAALEERGIDCETPEHVAALLQELDDHGITAETLCDAYCGTADGIDAASAGADYAQQLAEDLGVKLDQMQWPLTCVDWEAAWRELELGDGYSTIPAKGAGTFHIIRSI